MPDPDLTTEYADYVAALKAANVDALDVTTLLANDLATVRAASDGGGDPDEVDDYNTMMSVYLPGA